MDLNRIKVENFRSYECTGWVDVDEKLLVVGKNNAGKSNLLKAVDMALDISPTSPHEVEDVHKQDTERDITIECEFDSLSPSERDRFSKYIEDGRLWVRTVFPFNNNKKLQKISILFLKSKSQQSKTFES